MQIAERESQATESVVQVKDEKTGQQLELRREEESTQEEEVSAEPSPFDPKFN